MVQESRIQEQHQPTSLQNPQNQTSESLPKKQISKCSLNKTKMLKARQNVHTIFVRYRQGSDGAAQVGDQDTHGSIVEFEEHWVRVLICHGIFFQRRVTFEEFQF